MPDPHSTRSPHLRPVSAAAAVLAGILYALAMAGFDVWPLALVALTPLLYAIETGANSGRGAVLLGLLFGTTADAIGFHWLVPTLGAFAGTPAPVSTAVAGLVWLYQAGHFGIFAWLVWHARARALPFVALSPALFAAAELVYPQLFPAYFAASLHDQPHLLQLLDLGGPLLLSGLLVLSNAACYAVLRARMRGGYRLLGAAAGAWLVTLAYGHVRITAWEDQLARTPHVTVGLVQGNLGLMEKRRNPSEGLRRYRAGSLALEQEGPVALLVWPETALGRVPSPELVHAGLRAPLLTGALRQVAHEGRIQHFNSALLIGRDGRIDGSYDKTYLLPFAEFLPLGQRFEALYRLSPNSGRFSAGTHQRPLELGGHRIAVLICYEDIIPGFVRSAVSEGRPHLLVNITNDAWFGDTSEPWTHLGLAKLRAVEHHRYLVRATNSGVSAVVDPLGRLVARTSTFEQTSLRAEVAWLEGETLYARLGDWPGFLGLLCAALVFSRRRGSRAVA